MPRLGSWKGRRPNSFQEWVIGCNFEDVLPECGCSRKEMVTVSVSTDDENESDTVSVTYPRGRHRHSGARVPKKVRFNDKKPSLKSALKRSTDSDDESTTSSRLADDNKVSENGSGSGKSDEGLPKSDDNGKSASDGVASEDEASTDDSQPHPTCICLECIRGRQRLRKLGKKSKKKLSEGQSDDSSQADRKKRGAKKDRIDTSSETDSSGSETDSTSEKTDSSKSKKATKSDKKKTVEDSSNESSDAKSDTSAEAESDTDSEASAQEKESKKSKKTSKERVSHKHEGKKSKNTTDRKENKQSGEKEKTKDKEVQTPKQRKNAGEKEDGRKTSKDKHRKETSSEPVTTDTNTRSPVAHDQYPTAYGGPPMRHPHLILPVQAHVFQVEHAMETPDDPAPNAFIDTQNGIVRQYHGPAYGNTSGLLYPHRHFEGKDLPMGASHPSNNPFYYGMRDGREIYSQQQADHRARAAYHPSVHPPVGPGYAPFPSYQAPLDPLAQENLFNPRFSGATKNHPVASGAVPARSAAQESKDKDAGWETNVGPGEKKSSQAGTAVHNPTEGGNRRGHRDLYGTPLVENPYQNMAKDGADDWNKRVNDGWAGNSRNGSKDQWNQERSGDQNWNSQTQQNTANNSGEQRNGSWGNQNMRDVWGTSHGNHDNWASNTHQGSARGGWSNRGDENATKGQYGPTDRWSTNGSNRSNERPRNGSGWSNQANNDWQSGNAQQNAADWSQPGQWNASGSNGNAANGSQKSRSNRGERTNDAWGNEQPAQTKGLDNSGDWATGDATGGNVGFSNANAPNNSAWPAEDGGAKNGNTWVGQDSTSMPGSWNNAAFDNAVQQGPDVLWGDPSLANLAQSTGGQADTW